MHDEEAPEGVKVAGLEDGFKTVNGKEACTTI